MNIQVANFVVEPRRTALTQYHRDAYECVSMRAKPEGMSFNMGEYYVVWEVITSTEGIRLYRRISDFYIKTVSKGFDRGERYFLHD